MKLFLALTLFTFHALAEVKIHALRLKPGQDVRKEIEAFIVKEKISAGSILSSVGSLTDVTLRFANKEKTNSFKGHFEVVALSGTIGLAGSHLHMAVSDGEGKTIGGHLTEGNKVYTTLELIIGIYPNMTFLRSKDSATGFNELEVKK